MRVTSATRRSTASRYTSQAFFDLEAERMWTRVWQMACREEELPAAGDTIVYDIVGESLLVTRQADGSIRRLPQFLPHRGRKLLLAERARRALPLPVPRLHLGARRQRALGPVPVGLRARHATTTSALPEVRVGTWGGFVFVNMDPDGDAARAVPRRRCRSTSRAGASRTAGRRCTSRRSSAATGRWRRKPSWSRTTSSRRTRRSCRSSRTPTRSTTSTAST